MGGFSYAYLLANISSNFFFCVLVNDVLSLMLDNCLDKVEDCSWATFFCASELAVVVPDRLPELLPPELLPPELLPPELLPELPL